MQKFIALIVTGCLCVLAAYSCGKYCHTPERMVYAWKDNRSAALADVYGLTPDSVAEPIQLWRKAP